MIFDEETIEERIARFKAEDLISPPVMTPIYPGDPGWGENLEPEINPLFVEKYEADRKDLEKQYDELKSLGYSEPLARKISGYSETSILDDIDVKHKDKKRSKRG